MNAWKDEQSQLLREIDGLIEECKGLQLASANGEVRTYREATLSLTPTPKPCTQILRLFDRNGKARPDRTGGDGIHLEERKPRCIEEEQSTPMRYWRTNGAGFVNSAGDKLAVETGWVSHHEIDLIGTNSSVVLSTIECLNEWTKRRFGRVWQALFSGRRAIAYSFCWPDVVHAVAEKGDATMKRPSWMVEIGCVELRRADDGTEQLELALGRRRQNIAVELWNERNNEEPFFQGVEPYRSITAADEIYIGDPPEIMHCRYELNAFRRDSIYALQWLRRWCESIQTVEDTKTNSTAPPQREVNESDRENLLSAMQKSWKNAYLANALAESQAGRELTAKEAYGWLALNGSEGYTLPILDTFEDYLTNARRVLGEQRKTPRGGRRTGRSIVRLKDLDGPSGSE